MNKGLIIAASALALTAAACHKSSDGGAGGNVSSEDNMLVPADENSMGGDANAGMTTDNGAAGDNATGAENGMANDASNAM